MAKKHGISDQTLYAWRKRFGSMEVADTKRLKALEAENARLKRKLEQAEAIIDAQKKLAQLLDSQKEEPS